jgi:hypothetical protein
MRKTPLQVAARGEVFGYREVGFVSLHAPPPRDVAVA